MNLGNFVGGAVQTYQQQQRTNLAAKDQQDSVNLRDRQLKIAEADEAARAAERARSEALRADSAALFNKYYGEKQETVATTASEDGSGGAATVPTVKSTQRQPGMDSAIDGQWYAEHLAITAKHSGMDAPTMEKIAARVDEVRRTAQGKLLDKVSVGDEAAMKTLLTQLGKSTEGAKLDFRPVEGVNQIVLGDGTKLDLKRWAAANATAAQYRSLVDAEKGAQDAAKSAATTRNLGAQADAHTAEAALAPVKASKYRAEAGLAGARAANVGQTTRATADDKMGKLALSEAKAQADVDPSSMDGKTKNADQIAFLTNRAGEIRAAGKTKGTGIAEARKEWDAVATQAGAWAAGLAKLTPKERKAKYGTSDIASIKNEAIKRTLGVRAAPAADDSEED